MHKRMTPDDYAVFYQESMPILYRYILARVRNQHAAEDITGQAYRNLWQAMGDREIHNVKAYLFQIARNGIAEHFREASRTVSLDQRQESGDQEEFERQQWNPILEVHTSLDRAALNKQTLRLIRNLSEEEQTILTLRYIQDFSWEDVASTLGKSLIAVRVAHHRIIKKLRKNFGQEKNE